MTSVFISAPFAIVVALKIPKSFSLVAANCMQSFGWLVTTAIALYCVRTGNLIQHRRWMIRSYPFAMVFTAARTVRMFLPVARFGPTSGEAVLWICSALAAFLPSIFFDWTSIFRNWGESEDGSPITVRSRGSAGQLFWRRFL